MRSENGPELIFVSSVALFVTPLRSECASKDALLDDLKDRLNLPCLQR